MMPGVGRWQLNIPRPAKRNLAAKAYAGVKVSQADKPTVARIAQKGAVTRGGRQNSLLLPISTLPALDTDTRLSPVNPRQHPDIVIRGEFSGLRATGFSLAVLAERISSARTRRREPEPEDELPIEKHLAIRNPTSKSKEIPLSFTPMGRMSSSTAALLNSSGCPGSAPSQLLGKVQIEVETGKEMTRRTVRQLLGRDLACRQVSAVLKVPR
ncbi:hypothetical protein QBC34DRAFT_181986 [Podospora aff. communis PSN243]|uniref:Uncharacterized protein n=1 Tax=Podospora aff. communis PSN243 TaxID=3040156 RepID=A0AAV9G6X6_9PEZI|nr:hypothetical protein QBC34DRAFT_181986 [Podospora aff. communis PSN243]